MNRLLCNKIIKTTGRSITELTDLTDIYIYIQYIYNIPIMEKEGTTRDEATSLT